MNASVPGWPVGNGEMASRVRSHDWAATPLGPIDAWPQSLKTAVDLMLGSGQAMMLAWGPERTLLFNDAYAPMLGTRHPSALGRPFHEVWADVWTTVLPLVDRVFAGETVRFDGMPMTMTRHGYPEETWWKFSYSPVRDEAGAVAGLVNLPTDVTATIRAERAERAEAALRESEERHAFLVRFTDAVRGVHDPVAVATTACRMLLDKMGVDRAHWSEIDWETEEFVTVGSVHVPGVAPIEGRFPLAAWEPYSASHRAGRSVVVDDTQTDPRADNAMRAAAAGMDIGADLAAPVHFDGRLASVLAVKRREPHRWTSEDIALVESIAGRCWAEVERARAEAALRESKERQAFLLELSDALRLLSDPITIQTTAMKVLGAHMHVNRAFYGDAHDDHDTLAIGPGYSVATAPLEGVVRFSDFELDMLAWYQAGRTYVIDDTERDTRVGEKTRNEFRLIDVRAAVGVPLVKDGRVRAIVSLHQTTVRRWTQSEIALLEEVAERTWAAVERARAEAALRESEERVRDVLNSMAEGFALFGPDFTIRDVNEETVRLDGRPRDELVGRTHWEAFPGSEDSALGELYRRAMRDRQAGRLEHVYAWPGGREMWVDVRAYPTPDGGVASFWRDITANKRADAALRDSEERQRLMVQLVPVLLWSASPDGQAVSVNEGRSIYTGQSEAETQNFGWLDAIHPDDRAATAEAFRHAFATGEPLERQQRIRKAGDGYRWHLVRHVPVRDEHGVITRWFGAAIDIDELHQLQGRQQVLVAELQHRVRNILAVIRSIMRRSLDGEQSLHDYAQHLAGRMDALARTQVLLTRDVDARVGLEDLIRDELVAQAADEARVTIAGDEVTLPPNAAEVLGLAVHELATNAVKYGAIADPRATLVIEWRVERRDDEPWLVLTWRELGVAISSRAPRRIGFGSELITGRVPYELKGEGSLAIKPGGMECTIAFPLREGSSVLETGSDVSADGDRA